MKINRTKLINNNLYEEEADLTFLDIPLKKYQNLKSIDTCHVNLNYRLSNDVLFVEFKIKANLTLLCSYSLDDVPYKMSLFEHINFVNDKELISQETVYEPHNLIELDEYVLDFILFSIPTKVVKKGSELPKNGKGYRILSEDDVKKEREKDKTSPFDKLKDIKIDE
jgi:uncharacterized metal-binding protein YceD (DUF177 family)